MARAASSWAKDPKARPTSARVAALTLPFNVTLASSACKRNARQKTDLATGQCDPSLALSERSASIHELCDDRSPGSKGSGSLDLRVRVFAGEKAAASIAERSPTHEGDFQ
eukprot:CAMPEP_0197409648 /NCGR_PEP_ID=MMETSP1165-20131217/30214_1 /TAXON_ID=284809 /ORGANISM="Chrysocystis fragilis, Strain CCMP3189" /LENGTH=110 /DNA_ID=CAMNT_0042936123 /DNA_START=26 /DNA_END=356 /DNA_ORIENTATION=-